ncbi:autotransporter domain-containing protein [Novosphingobium sp.]|uniref:autotransporter domain-containing protein n=1 Tax=Novosphingobium sp. TaxID=1874826 RepID=UPI0027359D75|nr:autotransporter domain-containing protein [Novosphingobium sp.]MDP3906544.1 autotransporter domain-containing protein [Novosphingobium sp.]
MHYTSIRQTIGQQRSRARLALGSALSGTLALTLLAIPGTAMAANECGPAPLVPGTVTCTVATNPNATGITYINPPADLTVVLDDGVRIDTTGAPANGLTLIGTNAFTVNGGTNTIITTDVAGAHGALVMTTNGPVSVALDQISTVGAGAHGVVASSAASGPVTVRTNRITTVGAGSTGILAQSGGTGAVLVNSGTISTVGAGSDGINVLSTGGTATVNAGAITTLGAGANGIVASGANGATVNFTTISTTGASANGVLIPAVLLPGTIGSANAQVNGVSVTTLGAGSDGVRAIASTGTATVNVSGNISTQGDASRGIYASGPLGANVSNGGTITTAGLAANGVEAFSTTGPVAVTVRNVTTTGNGSQAVLVNAAAGNATVAVNGALRTTGTAANALTVNSGANTVVNVGSGASFSTVQGDYIRLNSAGTSTLNTAATIGNNLNGFALVATGGPIVINNTGNLSSDIVLTAGADVLNNSGTFTVGPNPDFGAGFDSFNNAGLVILAGGASTVVAPVFTGLESFGNSGMIDLRNGRAGDTLTLPGSYTGAGGTLGLDITTVGTVTTADHLIVGGAATGSTLIALNRLAGSVPMFTSGTMLVNAGAGSAANAFSLAGGNFDAGFVRYEVGFDAAGNNYVLTGAPSDTAFRMMNYGEAIRSLWLKSADAVSGQLRARRDTLWSQGGGDTTGRFWMQFHGSKESREGQRNFNAFGQSRLTDTGYDQDYFGGQLGLDISGSSNERGGFALGLTGGYLNSSLNFAGSADRVVFEVINAGVYASYSSGNLFFNALGKYDHYWATANTPSAQFEQKFTGNVYGARAELGLRFGSDSFFIEPAASISYVKNDTRNLTPLGTSIAFDDDDGLRGRIGGRIGTQIDIGGPVMALYAGANYVHEFKGRDIVTYSGGGQTLTYTNDRLRDYGEAVVGMTIAQNATVSGFLEANYIRSFSTNAGQRNIDGVGGRVGIRFKL